MICRHLPIKSRKPQGDAGLLGSCSCAEDCSCVKQVCLTSPCLSAARAQVQLDIREGHAATVDKVLGWIQQDGGLEGTTVCDAGCGTGALAIPLALRGARVYGSDISEAMVGPPPQQLRVFRVVEVRVSGTGNPAGAARRARKWLRHLRCHGGVPSQQLRVLKVVGRVSGAGNPAGAARRARKWLRHLRCHGGSPPSSLGFLRL